jgi:FSR family fosmidomycin resistance protein-like MFS transporter
VAAIQEVTIAPAFEHTRDTPQTRTEARPGRTEVSQTDSNVQTAQAQQFETGHVLTIAAGHTVHDTYTGFLPPLLPVLITNLSLSKTEAGLLRLFLQGPSLLQPVIGHLADRVNLRFLVIVSPAVASVIMSLVGIAPSYAVLALLLTVTGVSSAGFHVVASVTAGKLSGGRLGRGMSFWMFGAELGRSLGPVVVVSAIRLLGLERVPWLMIFGLLGSAVLYIRLRDLNLQPLEAEQGLPWRQAVRGMGRFMIPLVGITVARAFLLAALTTYLPTFLTEEGADLWLAGAALTLLEGAGTVGALLGGSLSDRLSRKFVLFVSLLASPVIMLVFLTVDGWGRFPTLVLLGLTAFAIAPILLALVQESFPQNRALANGIYMALAFISGSVMSVVVGVLGDLFGLRRAFTACAAIAMLAVPLTLWLPRTRVRGDI